MFDEEYKVGEGCQLCFVVERLGTTYRYVKVAFAWKNRM